MARDKLVLAEDNNFIDTLNTVLEGMVSHEGQDFNFTKNQEKEYRQTIHDTLTANSAR